MDLAPRPSGWRAACAVLAIALLSACGDDCDAPPRSPTNTPAAAPALTASPTATPPQVEDRTRKPTKTVRPTSPATLVATPTPTPTIIVTEVVLTIESVVVQPARTASVSVSLTAGSPVAGTQNDISLPIEAAITAPPSAGPDCAVNPDIDKGATAFAFQPPGCSPGVDCTAIRALVLSFSNTDPIPEGSVLYTCRLGIGGNALFGNFPLSCSHAGASDPDGNALPVTCDAGALSIVNVGGALEP